VTHPSTRARSIARLATLLLVTVLVALAITRLNLSAVLAGLAVTRPPWIVLALLCFLAILPLWALQWMLLAPAEARPRLSTMTGVVAMTSTVLNTTPLLVGEAAAVFFLVTRAGLGRAAALSLLAMDQLFVGIAKLLVLAAAAAMVTLPAWMARGAQTLLLAVGALALGVALVSWRAERVSARATRVLPERAARVIASLGAGLAPIRSPSRSGGALALALAKKAVETLAIYCVQRAFGVDLPLASALLVLAAVNLATLLPLVPGNLGVYEGAVVVAYAYLGITPERALGIALVQHACFFLALALPGYRWLARSPADPSSPAAA
jgi:uncharacterized membrane protein YbhN (UPF0104 family)